ncbi:pyridoxal phosphate-dependent aminotransferase [Lentilactobacillus hilgardii]|uniref:Putative transaminase n=1 Tax=Lentilactobacillus hilgardii (strain ATCC 8290 / DSM 20176 / CCUG 30140 / JCM 1155 / KCTC 3500 / NBRC 15886 / NCIMB 8040 / NRRL B-1843 / 9) TaxID=1423757 RepID=C0XKY3_LENH9|nr:pyridoxal phosphate-dependent aminotransferase [Lentilactobacillus hilgardii]EEI19040.1 putative transaminase [Lentilactobacillus buchneri ATCC 11577]EEI23967.1 putative transaminase [Lentilactobacillus hilgardii DSM 20176 = ATCC 8290]KRK53025.1 LL-diaminopimelate aminotransferase [Lentilactobacillus hilgardii DSM 20176 = ATCC 8290]MCP9334312.1 pyridoxal phosphate-dependent aminotransferase [Lentilactobacillus hilgardii]MCP9350886.1 pyridoxal phosphate-dependent aminotransferase [Lentilacto
MKFAESNVLQGLPKQFFANLVKKVNAKIATGADVINLGQGNPDQPTPDFIVKAMQEQTAVPNNHKYSQFRGDPALKRAAADFYKREYGVELNPDKEIAILGGSKIGLVELPFAILNPGDTMLLPDPGYPDYLSGAALAQVDLSLMRLKEKNNFMPDYHDLDPQIVKKAKLMYLNYPNNPTGAVATPDFFERTVAFANQNQIGVVHDFAYGAIGFDGKKPISFLQTPGAKEVGIETYTFSKSYNMAGWRIGFAAGNADMIEAINLLQDHLFVSVFPAMQKAAITALNSDQHTVRDLVALYEKRRNQFFTAARSIGWEPYRSGGSFYAWMPVPEGYTSESFADLLLEKAAVAVAPGNGFGDGGEGFVRVGLLIDEPRFTEACQRIKKLGLF